MSAQAKPTTKMPEATTQTRSIDQEWSRLHRSNRSVGSGFRRDM